MTFGNRESQLELFDVTRHAAPRPSSPTATGRVFFHLRYDQLILSAMAGLIGLTVIFASGVERGKQLVRSERVLLARQEPAAAPSAKETAAAEMPKAPKSVTTDTPKSTPIAPAASPAKAKQLKRVVVEQKTPAPQKTTASKSGASSRYAVQVSTFTRPHLAKQEMDRLRAKGEKAFLVMRDGRTMVYVGPFPSKVNASEKVANLKPLYQDCFVRTL